MSTPVRDRLQHELERAERDALYYRGLIAQFTVTAPRYEPDMDRCG